MTVITTSSLEAVNAIGGKNDPPAVQAVIVKPDGSVVGTDARVLVHISPPKHKPSVVHDVHNEETLRLTAEHVKRIQKNVSKGKIDDMHYVVMHETEDGALATARVLDVEGNNTDVHAKQLDGDNPPDGVLNPPAREGDAAMTSLDWLGKGVKAMEKAMVGADDPTIDMYWQGRVLTLVGKNRFGQTVSVQVAMMEIPQ